MKRILMGGFLVSIAVCGVSARTPSTSTEVVHPTTSITVVRPLTKVEPAHSTTSVEVMRSTTQTEVIRPQTAVEVLYPITQVQILHPQTTVDVIHPRTDIEVIHPQTTVEVFHPQTPEMVNDEAGEIVSDMQKRGGRPTSPSQVATSMTDFKPMQAKNLSVKPSTEKAALMGGGSMDLGNTTNQAEKDNVNKSSLLGAQQNAEDIEIDPKQNKLGGLEKLLTDRAKFEEKRN